MNEIEEDLSVVMDFPITAILANSETKEIRFALYDEEVKIEKDELIKKIDENI